MNLFQNSVIQKYLNDLDNQPVEKAFQVFKANYSPQKIEKIKMLKEEEYQDGFLRDIFVQVLGYTLKPDDNYNLVRELKNTADSKKADGAIIHNDKTIAVIEIKSTSTKDLTSVTQQAFNYKNNQPGCKYVITSNFQKLRFYIDYANEYEEFDLFKLQKSEFLLFYLLLSKESIFSNLPQKLKQETKFHEQQISEQLYKDYSDFKYKIFENLIKNNPEYDKLTLFEKSQKLLDRLLFMYFAEDRGLLPANSITRIIEHYDKLSELDAYRSLYDTYKLYFDYMNVGRKGKVSADDIPAYNGGLFAPDEILDKVIIDDDILRKDSLKLSKYDYSTEVDVNILGHIFEHSLNEIEEIEKQLSENNGLQHIVKTSKRKKDGVFYTPKYITQYIVENTLGRMCQNKRKELEIFEIEFDETYYVKANGRVARFTNKGKLLFEKLNLYKEWLKSLKIIDPACGSGAFLIQALNFLINEHKQIDDLLAELSGDDIRLFDTDKQILENNLYGVDINQESVEIAKLSLWLRTAQRGRALSDLSGNIKCGNSLIDDPEIAGDKAFDWEKEFPQVFNPNVKEKVYQKLPEPKPDYLKLVKEKSKESQIKAEQAAKLSIEALEISKKVYEYAEKIKVVNEPNVKYGYKKGGFDVVIGNPPYGVNFNKKEKKFLSLFDNLVPDYEIYIYFISLATQKLLKNGGKLGYIFPNTFLSILYGKKYREKLINLYTINEIVDLSEDNTFVDASVRTCILNLTNAVENEYKVDFKKISDNANKTVQLVNIYEKSFLKANLDNWLSISSVNTDFQTIINKIKDNPIVNDFFEISQGLIPYDKYRGHSEYQIKNRVWHSEYKKDDTYKKELKGGDISRYYLNWNGKLWISYGDWLAAPRKKDFFTSPRILVREITSTLLFCSYIEDEFYNTPSLINIIYDKKLINLKYLLTILNSKLIGWYHNNVSPKAKKGLFPKILINDVRNLPIKAISSEAQQPFIEKADLMLSLNKELQEKGDKFIRNIQREFSIEKISKKLQNWYEITYADFLNELEKLKIKLSLSQKAEWEAYFVSESQKLQEISKKINQTDVEIDRMVYKLYELTDEEIAVVSEIF